jgi:hypothetical protein
VEEDTMGMACSEYGRKRNTYRILEEKLKVKRPLRRSIIRREDNIKVTLSEIEWSVMDCIHLAQGMDQWRILVHTARKLRVP